MLIHITQTTNLQTIYEITNNSTHVLLFSNHGVVENFQLIKKLAENKTVYIYFNSFQKQKYNQITIETIQQLINFHQVCLLKNEESLLNLLSSYPTWLTI